MASQRKNLYVPAELWEWYGRPAHFCGSFNCRYHLATRVGKLVVSTVGEYILEKDEAAARYGDYLAWCQPLDASGHLFETKVFHLEKVCPDGTCCDLAPIIVDYRELKKLGANTPADARKNHLTLCEWAAYHQENRP